MIHLVQKGCHPKRTKVVIFSCNDLKGVLFGLLNRCLSSAGRLKKGGYGIYWNERSGRYYVYRDLAHVYNPKTKRSAVLEMVSLPTARLG